jgi:thiosulfate/3-mercaptopyruvate sulfurtransferase
MYTTIISHAELAAHLHDPDWIVFDCRHDLADTEAGRRAYSTSHIEGARFVNLDNDLSGDKTATSGRHPLPDAEAFCARIAALGVRSQSQVVAYDDAGGFYAARFWWMLRWVGHERVAVLDGGFDTWTKEYLPVTNRSHAREAGDFSGTARDTPVDAAYIMNQIGSDACLVVDARAPDRFRGENETLDPVGGHIPGAANRLWKNNLRADGRFKSPATLNYEFTQLIGERPPRAVIHQCGSGVTACHNLLAMEIAGLSGSRLYPGSWSEWCSDPLRPVAR